MLNENDYEIIDTYSRKDALEDGLLINLNSIEEIAEVVEEHYKFPVDITEEVYSIITAAVDSDKAYNDLSGVVHDILWMSKVCYEDISPSIRQFTVLVNIIGEAKEYIMKAVCGPGDDMKPIVTIMLPWQD